MQRVQESFPTASSEGCRFAELYAWNLAENLHAQLVGCPRSVLKRKLRPEAAED